MRIFLNTNNDGNDGNDVPIFNGWFNQAPTTWFNDIAIPAGTHGIRVEYYDVDNNGTAILRIENVNTLPPGWTGQYWNQLNFGGSVAMTRIERTRSGLRLVHGLAGAGRSAPKRSARAGRGRWTSTKGVYEFSTTSDDGARVYVDGQLILDFWIDQPLTQHIANKQMTAGSHTVVVEYYDNGGGAAMFFAMNYRPDLGGFVTDTIASGFTVPTVFAFAPDGRIFVGQKDGVIKIIQNGQVLGTPYYTVSPVNDYHDRGLLGLTLDPAFASNGRVYVAYTYDNNPADPDGLKTAQVIRVNASTPLGQCGVTGKQDHAAR